MPRRTTPRGFGSTQQYDAPFPPEAAAERELRVVAHIARVTAHLAGHREDAEGCYRPRSRMMLMPTGHEQRHAG